MSEKKDEARLRDHYCEIIYKLGYAHKNNAGLKLTSIPFSTPYAHD